MTDPELVAVLGKLGEEANELGKIIFRCLIQGIDEREPVTQALNREELEKEIADVEALIRHAKSRLLLDASFIAARADRKASVKAIWFDRLRDVFRGVPKIDRLLFRESLAGMARRPRS